MTTRLAALRTARHQEPTMSISLAAARADALFVSPIQPSETHSRDEVKAVIRDYVRRHGLRGLAALVAAEFGDHPDTAGPRMCWCLAEAATVAASARRGARAVLRPLVLVEAGAA